MIKMRQLNKLLNQKEHLGQDLYKKLKKATIVDVDKMMQVETKNGNANSAQKEL